MPKWQIPDKKWCTMTEDVVDLGIPFCKCHQFMKSGMVCKHILAAMENHHGEYNPYIVERVM